VTTHPLSHQDDLTGLLHLYQATLHVKGSAGVEVNGHLVLPPNVVRLNDLDVVTIRKKDFQLVLPLPEERVIRSKVSKYHAHSPPLRRL
jgi:hypothetical protein